MSFVGTFTTPHTKRYGLQRTHGSCGSVELSMTQEKFTLSWPSSTMRKIFFTITLPVTKAAFFSDRADAPLATDISLVCLRVSEKDPAFSTICSFTIPGLIQNVFLLDIPRRCFAAYAGLYETDCIGLFFLPDWSQDEYIFIDTDIDYVRLSSTLIYTI